MEFRDQLVKARKIKGYNQEELAQQIGVSRQAVSKWETGDAQPALAQLIALADALDISLDSLCGRQLPSNSSATATGSAHPIGAADSSGTGEPASDSSLPDPLAVPPRPKSRSAQDITSYKVSLWIAALPLLLAILIVAGMFWDLNASEEINPMVQLPDTIEVTGVYFYGGDTDSSVDFEFTPSIVNPDLDYTITFIGFDQQSHSFPVESDHGIFHGTARLPSGYGSYTVTLEISNGIESRAVALASGLTFDKTRANWNPLTTP